MFDVSRGQGLSAAALINEASKTSASIYTVTPANLVNFFMNSNALSASTRDAISQYASLGYEVMSPDRPIDAVSWKAEGYVALDPETGAGAYIISTGINGGEFVEFVECVEQSESLTKTIGSRIQTILIMAAAAALIAAGIVVAGARGGAASPVLVAVMSAVGVSILVFLLMLALLKSVRPINVTGVPFRLRDWIYREANETLCLKGGQRLTPLVCSKDLK